MKKSKRQKILHELAHIQEVLSTVVHERPGTGWARHRVITHISTIRNLIESSKRQSSSDKSSDKA